MIGAGLPGHAGTRSFVEPWHAQAFAAVFALNQAGCFTWAEWVETFAGEVARAPQRNGEEGEAAYYRQWVVALERILAQRGLVLAEEVATTAEDWRRSYLRTPHGKPVCLRRDLPDVPTTVGPSHRDHHHERDKRATPVAIDRPRHPL
jgi:nitrile hydratase accessory protein